MYCYIIVYISEGPDSHDNNYSNKKDEGNHEYENTKHQPMYENIGEQPHIYEGIAKNETRAEYQELTHVQPQVGFSSGEVMNICYSLNGRKS